jgi:hypothetical protein
MPPDINSDEITNTIEKEEKFRSFAKNFSIYKKHRKSAILYD